MNTKYESLQELMIDHENLEARLAGLREDHNRLDEGNIILNQKLAIAIEALEDARYYFKEDNWEGPMIAMDEALAKLKHDKK